MPEPETLTNPDELKHVKMLRFPARWREFAERNAERFMNWAGIESVAGNETGMESFDQSPETRSPELSPLKRELVDNPIDFMPVTEFSARRGRKDALAAKQVAPRPNQMAIENDTAVALPSPNTQSDPLTRPEATPAGLPRRNAGQSVDEFAQLGETKPDAEIINLDDRRPQQPGALPVEEQEPYVGRHAKPSPLDTSAPIDSLSETTPMGDSLEKKYNIMELRQEALAAAEATRNNLISEKGAEPAALSYAIRSGYEQNSQMLS